MNINHLPLFILSLFLLSSAASAQSTAPALKAYYGVKNALVATDAKKAKAQATSLVNTLGGINTATYKHNDKKALASAKSSALVISKTGDIEIQRTAFKVLSTNLIALAKATRPAKTYVQYCPMVKASWLSESRNVKNPYYGNEMLTCGSTKEVIE